MTEHRKVDLHIHTSVSDGTVSPEHLPALVRAAGIGIFSVTDHDAVKCSRIIPGMLQENDPVFIPGVEFSCQDAAGKYHILGYAYNPDAPAIQETVALGHRFRLEKLNARIACLKQTFGFDFPEEELTRLLALDNPGKPHLGNLMVMLGYAESKEEAIRKWIDRAAPSEHFHLLPQTAIQSILDSGGIPVLAHPCFGSGNELVLDDALERRVRHLLDLGLRGLECFYSRFSAAQRAQTLGLAECFQLYVTAGSDYHGRNKPVELGDTGLTDGFPCPTGLLRFLRDAAGV